MIKLAVMKGLADQHRTMVIVTHEMHFAQQAADRIMFMEAGRLLADQPAAQFFARPPSPRIADFLRLDARHSAGRSAPT